MPGWRTVEVGSRALHSLTSTDPVVTAIVEETFVSVASETSPLVTALVERLSQPLATAISTPVTDDTLHLPAEGIQLANSLAQGRGGPLEDVYLRVITSAVIQCLRTTEDMDVVQACPPSSSRPSLMWPARHDTPHASRPQGLRETCQPVRSRRSSFALSLDEMRPGQAVSKQSSTSSLASWHCHSPNRGGFMSANSLCTSFGRLDLTSHLSCPISSVLLSKDWQLRSWPPSFR